MRIIWSPQAMQDLDAAYAYLVEDRPKAAARLRIAIADAIQNLLRFPGMGRPGQVPNTRELVISRTPFIIPYAIEDSRIVILRVYHGAQS